MKLISFPEKRQALAFSDYLRSVGIGNRIEPDVDGYAILLEQDADSARAQQEVDAFVTDPGNPRYWQVSWQTGQVQAEPVYADASQPPATAGWWQRAGPLTRSVALLCVVVFAALNLAPELVFGALHYPDVVSQGITVATVATVDGQWWRLLTPAILHFSLMHIAFNLLWWWELGGLIERGQSAVRLLGVSVVIALVSNAAQGLQYGSKFGGLSGVIYGLLGYLWMYPLFNPAAGFRLRKEILWFMLGWLALGYTGLIDAILGPVSNTGHLSGLLAGMALGVLVGGVNRGQATRQGSPTE